MRQTAKQNECTRHLLFLQSYYNLLRRDCFDNIVAESSRASILPRKILWIEVFYKCLVLSRRLCDPTMSATNSVISVKLNQPSSTGLL